ncbi:DegV family protein [Macrococcus hajekii]|uniref:DegV family protein n=1 Tax=Macrococcus hajekii TaxID=198482 RepID=A0A4R6BIK6_9STAP|nr:DegV family protein [Macrococcus hajekii]TDM01475.1 DegV family protein [Macrococcus hajekii]GGB00278.1 DegV domain-containing protein [Macrococcus hajekii]
MKIAVLTDSTANIGDELRKRYDIKEVYLSVLFKGQAYREMIDISPAEFYARMRAESELPSTSQPSIGEYVDKVEELKAAGYTDVIAIHLSSGISGTYQNAIAVNDMVKGIRVHAVDSEISLTPQAFLCVRAAQMIEAHASVDEIVTELKAMVGSQVAYFMVNDLKNLKKGGRLSGAQAFVGSMLQVKPILHFVDTKIEALDKVRTKKKALKRIEELMVDYMDGETTGTGCILHANAEEEAKQWLQEVKEQYPEVQFIIHEMTPVIGTHLGEGALAFGMTKRVLNL